MTTFVTKSTLFNIVLLCSFMALVATANAKTPKSRATKWETKRISNSALSIEIPDCWYLNELWGHYFVFSRPKCEKRLMSPIEIITKTTTANSGVKPTILERKSAPGALPARADLSLAVTCKKFEAKVTTSVQEKPAGAATVKIANLKNESLRKFFESVRCMN